MTNPYAPPQSLVVDVPGPAEAIVPAERLTRFGAAVVDSLLFGVLVYLPIAIGITTGTPGPEPNLPSLTGSLVFGCLGFLGWSFFTIKYVRANGQSIAKRMLDIKVVRTDGSPASLGRIFWLRNVLNGALSLVPGYGLVDILFIFGDSQQCLHDKLAGTIVVKA